MVQAQLVLFDPRCVFQKIHACLPVFQRLRYQKPVPAGRAQRIDHDHLSVRILFFQLLLCHIRGIDTARNTAGKGHVQHVLPFL